MIDPVRSRGVAASLAAKARALGFGACHVTSAEPPLELGARLSAWLAEGAHGEMGWMADTLDRRADPRALMAGARSLVMLGLNYGPGEDPLAATRRQGPRRHLGLRPESRLPRRRQGQAEGARGLARRRSAARRGRRQGVRRHRAADGEAFRGASRDRLAGQAHQPRVAGIRLLAVSGRDPDRPRPRAGCAGDRPLRNLPRLSRRLSDARLSRAVPDRRPALHLLPDNRVEGPDSPGLQGGDRQSDLRL